MNEIECFDCQQPTSKCMCNDERFQAALIVATISATVDARNILNIGNSSLAKEIRQSGTEKELYLLDIIMRAHKKLTGAYLASH